MIVKMRTVPFEFSRSQLVMGRDAIEKLQSAAVAVFGIGGVGSYAAEGLARAGVGSIALFDDDKICLTNINRQIIALHSTVGVQKVDAMAGRILDINPNCRVEKHQCFYTPENADDFDLSRYTYLVDAMDTVSAKLELIVRADHAHVPVISCMGAGNKLDPTRFEVTDIYKTSVCPLARVMRHELRARGIGHLKVVYSKEPPLSPPGGQKAMCRQHCVCPPGTKRICAARRAIPGSVSFVPPVAGMILAGEAVKDIAGCSGTEESPG
ncbi:MAG: tRNA threonylcarbamoyladenosine dehydratase [Oscillospiraceae bacterium]|jgi:tRNA A37 threonylcarbamoyladenosine dehydratase|nr:tRNA threonylcarbamoyladenosine dehydratase [Oscillospiraceae bacterium]MCI2034504.1 tRNA threonylcarbamoyladenosine dehydratase [Oscillospiraceae bacterium]